MTAAVSPHPVACSCVPCRRDARAARDARLTDLLTDVELRVAAEDAAALSRPSP